MSERRHSPTLIDLTGRFFGAWHVTQRAPNRPGTGATAYWTCLCLCGNVGEVAGNMLRNGRSTRCRPCAGRGDTRVRPQAE